MLGYYAVLHVLIAAFGHGALVLRLPSVIGAAAAVALVALLAERLWGRWTALVAGILSAVSLTLVYWGQGARAYALMIALIAASFVALLSLLRTDRPVPLAWVLYVVVSVAAVYASLEAVLIFPAQLLILFQHRQRVRSVVSAMLVALVCCIPLFVLAAERGSSQLFWVPAPSWRTAKQLADALASSGLQPGYYVSTGNALLVVTGLIVLAGAVGLWRSERVSLALAWLVVPVIADLVVSLVSHSIFQARYVLVSLPAAALVMAWALTRGGLPRPVAIGALVAVLTLRALALAPSYGVSAEFWRGGTRYVQATARRGDCIAFYPLDARMPFEYYGGPSHRLPRPVLPALPWGTVRSYVEEYRTLSAPELAALSAVCSRVWLVWSHEGRLGGPAVSGANYLRLRALRGALAARYAQHTTRIFGRASPISIELFTAGA